MQQQDRLHALDAVRAFALLLGIFLHAAVSFISGYKEWAIADNSPSIFLAMLVGVIHIFRMSLFFLIAGFFAHLVYHRKGAQAFARDRVTRIVLPFIVGWCVMAPLLGFIWQWGHDKAGIVSTRALWPSAVEWLSGEVRLTHLWFLYYLVLIYVIVVGARHVLVERFDASGHLRRKMDQALRKMLEGHWAPAVLALPLAVAAIFAPEWNPGSGMPTPDRSLIPELIPTVGYSVAFVVGWLFHRDVGLLQVLTAKVKSSLWLSLASMMVMGTAANILQMQPTLAPTLLRFLSALGATMLMWYFNFALVGFALKKFADLSPRTRYVADASYWVYIAHLPIVCVLQVWVADWSLHWTFKYTLIISISFAALFASYHYLVRFTFIGAVLNGRKYSRHEAPTFSMRSATEKQA